MSKITSNEIVKALKRKGHLEAADQVQSLIDSVDTLKQGVQEALLEPSTEKKESILRSLLKD